MPDKTPLHLKEFRVAIDSGAHTWYVQHFGDFKGLRAGQDRYKDADYSILESDEFQDYLQSYIDFLHINKDNYDFYVTLDIIGNPKKSWEITEQMEAEGLTPIPVFHFGEDYEWLERMVEKYDYIGMGGLGQDVTKEVFYPFADKAFNIICGGGKTPKVKVHGFAVASVDVITRYPWYTCDASTWTALSRNGTIYIPKPFYKNKEIVGWNYLVPPMSLPTTVRRTSHKNHVNHKSPLFRDALELYFEQNGYTFDCIGDYNTRDVLNIRYFKQLEIVTKKVLKRKFDFEKGGNILLAGTPSGASTNLHKFVDLLADLKEPKTSWLGSFYYTRHNKNLLEVNKAVQAGRDLRELQTEIEAKREVRKQKRLAKEEATAKRQAKKQKKIERVRLPEVKEEPVQEPSPLDDAFLLPVRTIPGVGVTVWYSFCSAHQTHDRTCETCKKGTWHLFKAPPEVKESIPIPEKGFFDLNKLKTEGV